MSMEVWLGFFAACWVISLSPGAGAIASMSSGLQYGFWRGYWNALGLQIGLIVQIAIIAAGVGAILAASDEPAVRPIGKPLSLVFRGFLVNVSNPKALVFMLAVLPQFINPHEALLPQYVAITVTMITVDMLVMAGYTGLASRVLRLLRTPKQQKRLNRTFAGLFLGAATFLATLRRAPI